MHPSFLVGCFVIQNDSTITWYFYSLLLFAALKSEGYNDRFCDTIGKKYGTAPPITSTTSLANNKIKTGGKPYGYWGNVTAEAHGVTHYMFS